MALTQVEIDRLKALQKKELSQRSAAEKQELATLINKQAMK